MDMSQILPTSPVLEPDSQLGLPEIPAAHPALMSLAQVRLDKAFTPEFAASSLRLSTTQILALEQQNWQRLPGPAYIKGFLRSYCKLLNVDAQPYLDQYAQTLPLAPNASSMPVQAMPLTPAIEPATVNAVLGDPQLPLAHFDEANELNVQRKRTVLAAIVLIGATLLFLLYWEREQWLTPLQAMWIQWFPAPPSIAAPTVTTLPVVAPLATDTTQAATVLASSPSAPALDVPSALAASSASQASPALSIAGVGADILIINAAKTSHAKTVDVQFLEPVWLELRDKSGAAIITGMHKPGTGAKVKADVPLLLIVGASHAVKVKVEGNPLDLEPHTTGNVSKVKIL